MSIPTADTQINAVSAAAQTFVDHYYEALARPRRTLAPFYASTSPRLTSAGIKPDISINGRVCSTVTEYESLLETQGAPVSYDVRSFDAQPVNPVYGAGQPDGNSTDASADKGDLVSFALQVSGVVKLGRGHVSKEDETPVATNGAAMPAPAVAPVGTNVFEKKEGPVELQFNEAFLLVPHWEAWARNAPRNMRKWVIVSQNYRTL